MSHNRLVISAPKSGSGKTLITIALMQAFLDQGKTVSGFKCGPDYIDPLFHQKVLGIPSKNLDLFFTDEKKTRALFQAENKSNLSIIEGVMGLYDGLSATSDEASTYRLAAALKAPLILVIDARGMAFSVIAEIKGFLSLDIQGLIKGVILNNTSKALCEKLRPVIEEKCGIALLGCFPNQKDLEIESRHLGLKLPDEISDIKEKVKLAAERIKKSVDLGRLFEIAQSAPDLPPEEALPSEEALPAGKVTLPPLRIALARDQAFCFYYEDNLRLLRSLGADLVEFSPIHDKALPPDISGLILGGGYPEFYARALEANESLRQEIRQKIEQGLPSLAECGGFMYLHNTIQTHDKSVYKMAGVINADVRYTGKLVRFGYASVKDKKGFFCRKEIRGHEFHYFDSSDNGSDCLVTKTSGQNYETAQVTENHFWSFLHLYYPSNPEFAANFVEKCRRYSEKL